MWFSVALLLHGDFSGEMFEATTRTLSSRIKADLRSDAIALEEYHKAHHVYPAWSLNKSENANGRLTDKKETLSRVPTFLNPHNPKLITLTTPVAYLGQYYADPFSPIKSATFGYWTPDKIHGTGYILWSAGPDKKYDLTIDNIAKAYDTSTIRHMPSELLISLTYDPTNGIKSGGDIWRIKE